LPKRNFSKRSGSTYGDAFEDSPEKRSKSKALNNKINFRLEELSKQCKFPVIPKGKIGDEYITKNSIKARINDFGKIYKLNPNLKFAQLNRTVDDAGMLTPMEKNEMKLKAKLSRKSSILSKIAESQNALSILKRIPKAPNVYEYMKPSFDRPKVSALQDTLNGIIPSSSELKIGQRKYQRFRQWGGIKIPIGSTMSFNRHKDTINKWDDKRDGIFNEL
jgi:hypothetical protein